MDFLDEHEWPLSANAIAKLCKVSKRTAQRWLSGQVEPPHTAVRLIQLTQRKRIMPDSWPSYFRFCYGDDSLDVGHKIRLHDAMLEHHAHSVHCWHTLLRLHREIYAKIDHLESKLRPGQIVELDNYRRRLKEIENRPFTLASGYEAPVDKNVIPFRNNLL